MVGLKKDVLLIFISVALGLLSNYFLFIKNIAETRSGLVREKQYEFLFERHNEMRSKQLQAKKAFDSAYRNPSKKNVELLISDLSDIPTMFPNFSSNQRFTDFAKNLPYELDSISEDEIKVFMDTKVRVFFCIFEMNIYSTKLMMQNTLFEDRKEAMLFNDFPSHDSICYD